MNMDKKLALLTLAYSGLFSAASFAVNIDITGTVVASPCIVNSGTPSLSVNLGDDIQADSLSTSGSVSDWKEFTLALTNCPASTSSFSVAFSGDADTTTPANYKNTGTATNLSLELGSQDGTKTFSNGTSLDNVTIPSSHSYDLLLRTRAVSTGNVMPGSITGQVQATFTYQ